MKGDYEYKLKRSPIPTIAGGITAAIYAAVFMIAGYPAQTANLWLHIPAAVLIAGTAAKTASFFCPIQRVKTQKKYIAPVSGISDVDKQLREADRILKEADKFAQKIKPINGTIAAATGRITATSRKILEYVAVNTRNTSSLHRFFGYYLPTLEKLLKNYMLLENHAADTANAEETKQEIENAVCSMEEVFAKQLDKLFDETTLDITTDIDVLETVITSDIGEDIKKKSKTKPADKDI